MRALISCSVACVLTAFGLNAQDMKPAFETGNEVDSKLLAERVKAVEKRMAQEKDAKEQAAKHRLDAWMAKKFWFVPNQKRVRLLRYGFASKLQKDALKESALLYPTRIVVLKVLAREKCVNSENDGYTQQDPREGDYLRVRFEEGPEAYILEKDFSRRLSNVAPETLPKRLFGDEVSNLKALMSGDENATEEFFDTDPIKLFESFDEAWKQQEAADDLKAAQNAKKKKVAEAGKKRAATSGHTGGVEIRLSRGVVRTGISSDQFVAIVPASAIIDQRVVPDSAHPGSMKVWKDCLIEGREFTVLLARITDPGPYIVVSVIPK
jgi:hypothetical protein